MREGIDKGKLSFLLRGEKLKGSFALVRTKDAKNWLLIKHKDRFATHADVTAQNRSVLSGVAVEDLKIVPAHRIPAAQLVPAGQRRARCRQSSRRCRPRSATRRSTRRLDVGAEARRLSRARVHRRAGRQAALAARPRTRRRSFRELVAELAQQAVDGMILDGEIVAFDAERQAVVQRAAEPRAAEDASARSRRPTRRRRCVFYCFDLLHFAGIDLRQAPYRDRRRYLAQCLLPSPLVQLVHAAEDGVALHAAALASGFEGVIGKRKDSRYEAGPALGAWLKVKPTQSADFVIGGYTSGKGSRAPLGALLVGYWDKQRQAALRLARRLRLRRALADAGAGSGSNR